MYTCPMHPEVQREVPGRCPECGMELLPEKARPKNQVGHDGKQMPRGPTASDKHEGHSLAVFMRKFWVSLALTVPIVAYSDLPEHALGVKAPSFPGTVLLLPVLGSIVFFYCGWVFLRGAVKELQARLPGMMTLIALAVTSAYSYSMFVAFAGRGDSLMWELSTLITVMLLGHWIEMRAVQSTSGALRELAKLLPDTAEVIRAGKTETIPLAELREGDLIMARPGGRIAADGEVAEGSSEVNESMVTGESKPVKKENGGGVIAGTVNGDGALTIRVTKLGDRTFLAGVMRLVSEAQASKSRLQILSDRAAFFLTVIAVSGGLVTLVVWLVLADPGFAIERMVSVLVVACPHALGLAVPLVASISTMLAARNGFLVKQRLALEAARNITIVLFDKTGTLTKGEYGVTRVMALAPRTEGDVLRLAAAVDQGSEHVVAQAIVRAAGERRVEVPPAQRFARIPGRGVEGVVEGVNVRAGGASLLDGDRLTVPTSIAAAVREESAKGSTVVYIVADGAVMGAISLADVIREESKEAVAALKAMGVKTAMVTGDSEDVAAWVAREVGLDEYFARVLPQDKAEKVKSLQARGLKVAMVGDGINDAPALTQADVGIAIGAGTNVAIESAGIILVRNDPRDIVGIIKLSRATYRKMVQNLFWATSYNVAALPLAAGVLASRGIIMQPALAAVFMSLSTVIVAVNAMTLRTFRVR